LFVDLGGRDRLLNLKSIPFFPCPIYLVNLFIVRNTLLDQNFSVKEAFISQSFSDLFFIRTHIENMCHFGARAFLNLDNNRQFNLVILSLFIEPDHAGANRRLVVSKAE
jgi:hypothetical protein